MSSKAESGNYVNVANANTFNEQVKTFTKYNPANEKISLSNLEALYQQGQDHLDKVRTAKSAYTINVDHRQSVFEPVQPYTTRLIAGLAGTNVSAKFKEDAKAINNKIQNQRIIKIKINPDPASVENNPESNAHSTARQSYNSIYDNFASLANLYENAEGYNTNDEGFKLPAINALKDSMKDATEKIDTGIAAIIDKRGQRNTFLYAEETGLVDTYLDAKEYVKSIYGSNSPEFKAVNKIKFRNIR